MRIMDRPGFQVRHPIMEDLKAVTDLIVACDIEEAFRDHWEYTPADLAHGAAAGLITRVSIQRCIFWRWKGTRSPGEPCAGMSRRVESPS